MLGTRLKSVAVVIAVVLTALWLLSVPAGTFTGGFWPLRGALVIYSGIMATGLMSVSLILAARPVQIEGVLGGLDKFYRLHRWLGTASAIFAVAHWLAETGPRWMVQQGWLTRPVRPPGASAPPAGFDPFRDWHDVAAGLGGPAFLLLLALVALALWKRVPYRYFFRAHRLLAPVYLVLVFHSVILMGPDYWAAPVGPVLGVLMAGGSVAAFTSIFHRIGKSREAVGAIESLEHHRDDAVLEVVVRLATAWPGHRPGQFAFVNFGGVEGAHPFTIASSWHQDGRLTFGVKALGDYTRALPEQLFAGQAVTVQGPYGRFDFQGGRPRQIWVAGGIGITPFIAGLEALADRRGDAQVDLIYSMRAPAPEFAEYLRQLADDANARLHLMVEETDGRLTLDRLEAMVPDWKEADVWFCGPLGFGDALGDAMVARGFPAARFHREMFDMR